MVRFALLGVFAFAGVIGLSGCRDREPAAAPAAAPSARLKQIFVYEMLGARIAYLESLIGPAMRVEGDIRRYKVDGCDVGVGVDGEEIRFLQVGLSPVCTFDPKSLLWNESLPPLDRLTFGDFERAAGKFSTRYEAGCLAECGREGDLGVYESWAGSMADAQMEVVLEADQTDSGTRSAIGRWESALEKAHGSAWIQNASFNCDDNASDLGKTDLAGAKVAAITIGLVVSQFEN